MELWDFIVTVKLGHGIEQIPVTCPEGSYAKAVEEVKKVEGYPERAITQIKITKITKI